MLVGESWRLWSSRGSRCATQALRRRERLSYPSLDCSELYKHTLSRGRLQKRPPDFLTNWERFYRRARKMHLYSLSWNHRQMVASTRRHCSLLNIALTTHAPLPIAPCFRFSRGLRPAKDTPRSTLMQDTRHSPSMLHRLVARSRM